MNSFKGCFSGTMGVSIVQIILILLLYIVLFFFIFNGKCVQIEVQTQDWWSYHQEFISWYIESWPVKTFNLFAASVLSVEPLKSIDQGNLHLLCNFPLMVISNFSSDNFNKYSLHHMMNIHVTMQNHQGFNLIATLSTLLSLKLFQFCWATHLVRM